MRPAQRLLQAPAADRFMVAGQQHVRYRFAFIYLRPRVVRTVQQTTDKRIFHRRSGISEHARQLADNGVNQHHRRQLATGQHEIAEADLVRDAGLDHALVDAAAEPGGAAGPLIGFGQVRHTRLRPRRNAFAYPTYFLMLPLRSLKAHGSGALARNRRAALAFHDRDHGDGGGLLLRVRGHGGDITLVADPQAAVGQRFKGGDGKRIRVVGVVEDDQEDVVVVVVEVVVVEVVVNTTLIAHRQRPDNHTNVIQMDMPRSGVVHVNGGVIISLSTIVHGMLTEQTVHPQQQQQQRRHRHQSPHQFQLQHLLPLLFQLRILKLDM